MAQPPPYSNVPPQQGGLYPTQPMAYPAPPAGPPPPGPPPAYAAGPPPPAQPPQHTTVVVQQKPVVVQQKKSGGLFSSFMKEVDKVGKQIGKEVDYCGKKINEAVDKNASTALLGIFATNNVVQLIARSTGKTTQILLNQQGHMILDGNGPLDPNAFNSWWTVINEGNNQVRLYNNNNYLAIIKGCTTVVPIVPGVTMGRETKFQLSQINSQYLTLESLSESDCFVSFYSTGQIKPAGKRDLDSHFAVKLVSTAYPTVHTVK